MPRAQRWPVKKAAEEIGVAHTTLYRWVDRDEVEYSRSPGGFVIFTDKEVRRLKEWVAEEKLKNGGQLRRGGTPGRYTPYQSTASVRRRGSGS